MVDEDDEAVPEFSPLRPSMFSEDPILVFGDDEPVPDFPPLSPSMLPEDPILVFGDDGALLDVVLMNPTTTQDDPIMIDGDDGPLQNFPPVGLRTTHDDNPIMPFGYYGPLPVFPPVFPAAFPPTTVSEPSTTPPPPPATKGKEKRQDQWGFSAMTTEQLKACRPKDGQGTPIYEAWRLGDKNANQRKHRARRAALKKQSATKTDSGLRSPPETPED